MAGPFTVINKNSFSIDTAANPNDRTNINDGYLQVQATITQALQEKNPLLSQTTFPAVVLHTSDASADIPYSDLFVSSLRHVVNPQVKVYFRVPLLHSNLPLPRALEDENLISEINKLSKLDPEYHEKFLISCHPFFYMDMNDAISLCPKDIIEVKFDDDTWTSARFQKLIAKGPNNTVPLKLTVQNLIVDMFDDAAEAVFLGPENEKTYTNVIYEIESELEKVDKVIETSGWPATTAAVAIEYKKWKYGAIDEKHPEAYPLLKTYWDSRGVSEWTPSGDAWSAVFVSFILKDSGFPGATSHRSYTRKVIARDTQWTAYSILKNKRNIKVGIGDVLIKPRGDPGNKKDYGKTHGDVVYKIEKHGAGFKAFTAGGNLGGTAKDGTTILLDGEKKLLSAGKYSIILKYGSLITQ
tara:strand:+ start:9531 stop:10766 length:1236 start_codon:yes stop_codon:yes gene_type:complete